MAYKSAGAASWLFRSLVLSGIFLQVGAAGVPLDLDNDESIKSAASRVAYDLVTFYTGNDTGDVPGNLPDPYYWWEAGAFFGALVNYWAFTGDTTYNAITVQALEHQAGPKGDFMPLNQTYTEGNDDQSFWAMSAMMAAERNFPHPVASDLDWLGMVQGVFNQQAHRWDNLSCNGGLRWQIYTWNAGYGYKNTISNGGFFDLAARLARYTGNTTYADWADKVWDWSEAVGLITPDFQIYDGTTDVSNCSSYDRTRWSYTGGIWLHGAAVMYNYTLSLSAGSPSGSSVKWRTRLDGLLVAANHFYSKDPNGAQVMHEPPCESIKRCNVDQLSFKAYLSRWLADVIQLAPHTYDEITAKVRSTAKAAVGQCLGGKTGTYCGHQWSSGKYDGTIGVGQQMGVLEVLHGLLASKISGPLTAHTGGTNEGNSSAGTAPDETDTEILFSVITTGDRVGAAFLTTLLVGLILSAIYVMIN